MYEKVSPNQNVVEREKKTEQFWKENHIFEKTDELRRNGRTYTIYDGPPTANGKPHIGHVLTRVIKDLFPRYHCMKGEHVTRKAGWDTHGLPVEIEVEKLLGLNGKEQIEQYGLAPFITKCKESVWKYKGMWEDFSSTVAYWADMEHPYVTYDNNYIESVWWSLRQVWDKGLLYKGFKVVPYCPRCGTPLASHEVAQGYKDVKERSCIAKFAVKGEENTYFLAWTTTPWTLPSNVALCVGPDFDYVQIATEDTHYILAEALLGSVIKSEYTIEKRWKGRELEYKEYIPLFDFVQPKEKAYYVTLADYVTLTDGTGIVHIAPAFGADDAEVGRKYALPFVQLVDAKGLMTKETKWAGMFCKDADKEVFADLKSRGLLYAAPPFEHSYPFCWRCDTPLIYYARESWFIQMSAVRDKLIANNNTINWIPESIGKKRFGDWLENAIDWGISRNRYWGTPLPIWECECGHKHCIGSIEELRSMSDNCPENIELHRPYIDEVTIKCPHCGKEMHRVKEVIDCWYDSGSMPFAQWHYPFENKEVFEKNFPADFISEAVDQTRGWFYSLLAISTLIFDKAPYKNVIVLGLVQDENGQKMSKSKGNAVDPFDALAEHGADAIRWYFYTNSAPWLPSRFYSAAVSEGQRKFMGTLWNTYAFFVLYANIDNFDATKYSLDRASLTVMDKWLLSKLNTLIKDVDDGLANYKVTETAKLLENFTDELSNWYVRRSRERFWTPGMEQDKINAYMTLYTALVTLVKLSAPMVPFISEEIYRNLVCSCDDAAPISVHLCDFPSCDESLIDRDLEEKMEDVLDIVVLGRACRNNAVIKNRQPIAQMFVKADFELPKFFSDIVADELNVKDVKFTKDVREFTTYTFKPQLRTVGPKYGKYLGKIRTMLSELDGNAAMDELNSTGMLKLDLGDMTAELTKDDLLTESAQKEGFASASDHGITVVLDTNLTPELIEEGFVREIVSKIQTMRKDSGFEVMDRINVYFGSNETVKKVAEANKDEICSNVLANELFFDADKDGAKDWNLNGEDVKIAVEKVAK
ncbi:MAG: isoleucine--tRNA ligase [Clostridia bacterium]|nr:isoleucine--tRNA ligase [Clostridia bacterium]